jgi:predicted nucleic acid-binding protein
MNGGIMLDTNVIIYSLGCNAAITHLINNKEHFISEITEIELLGFHGLNMTDEKVLNAYLSQVRIISLNASIKKVAIEIRRQYKLKTIDAVIAASAIYFDLPLITADKAFKKNY